MASFAQHLFVFNPQRFDKQSFVNHIFHNLALIPNYTSRSRCYTLHLPEQTEDFYDDSEAGWSLDFIHQQYLKSPHGGFFDLIYQPAQSSHGFSLHFNNLEANNYLILDWKINRASILIDEKSYLLFINGFLQADKIYTSSNWLNSVSFVDADLNTFLETNPIQIL